MARPTVKHERRAQILDGLYEAMSRQGTRGTSITEIAKAAGIARGALHYYFDSKEEIRVRLMERLGERYIGNLQSLLATRDDKLDALARFHFGGDADESERLLTVWIDYWGQAPSDAEVNAVVFGVQKAARAICADAIRQHRHSTRLLPLSDGALNMRAAAALALIEGTLLQWRVATETETPLHRKSLKIEILAGLRALADAPDARVTTVVAQSRPPATTSVQISSRVDVDPSAATFDDESGLASVSSTQI